MSLNAYIVAAVRTPAGKNRGLLSQWQPADLGGFVLDALVARAGIDAAHVDDVIMGCVSQIGAQSGNLGRMAVLASKSFPISVPGTTVDRQCGSSLQALHFAAQAVQSGAHDVVIAAGVESMSLIPIGASIMDGIAAGRGNPNAAEGIQKRYPGVMFSQFEGAELVAEHYGVPRAAMDQLAVESHRRAHEATQQGRFKREIVPTPGFDKKANKDVLVDQDEGIRWPTTLDKLSQLPTLKDGGRITAATASQISDGASAMLIVNERGLRRLGLKPRARVVAMALAADDPVMMLSAPIPASFKVLEKAGLSIGDIDLYEVNEAFASVPLAWAKELKADLKKLNVNGGAMALGHPLGCTGTKIMTTLLHELERRNARYGLCSICEGGSTANAIIIERVTSPLATAKL